MYKLSPSVGILQENITKLFKQELGSNPLYPALPDKVKFKVNPKNVYDIVLMGDVLSLLQFIDFSKDNPLIRLWCLSHKHAELISEIFQIPISYIGVIPRYKLFRIMKNPRMFPTPKEPMTLVLASRWIIHKKNKQALELSDLLRNKWEADVRIIHAFPSKLDLQTAKKFIDDLKIRDIELITKGKNWFNFIEKHYPNPVFISLSNDIFEDFGVSLAQVEARGWPCILSAWGAHLDAKRSWRMFIQDNGKDSGQPLAPEQTEDDELSLPEIFPYHKEIFSLDKETIMELIFNRQRLTSQFDERIRNILKK